MEARGGFTYFGFSKEQTLPGMPAKGGPSRVMKRRTGFGCYDKTVIDYVKKREKANMKEELNVKWENSC